MMDGQAMTPLWSAGCWDIKGSYRYIEIRVRDGIMFSSTSAVSGDVPVTTAGPITTRKCCVECWDIKGSSDFIDN